MKSENVGEAAGNRGETVLRVTVEDMATGARETSDVPAGEYLLICTAPCYESSVQAYPAKGTHVITVKGRTARP